MTSENREGNLLPGVRQSLLNMEGLAISLVQVLREEGMNLGTDQGVAIWGPSI